MNKVIWVDTFATELDQSAWHLAEITPFGEGIVG